MNTRISQQVLKMSGLMHECIVDTVKQPDRKHILRVDGGVEIRLHLKRPPAYARALPLLVIGRLLGGEFHVDGVFRIPLAIAREAPQDATPLDLLQRLAEDFGFLLEVDGKRSHLIVQEVFPLEGDVMNLVRIVDREREPAQAFGRIAQTTRHVDGKAQRFAAVTLWFVLRDKAYSAAVGL